MPPRPFHPQPHGSPVVVSSLPHMAPVTPVNRALGQTPPIVHSRTPPAPRLPTPQPAPSTPSVASLTHVNCMTPTTGMTTPTPPPIMPPRASLPAEQRPSFVYPLPWLSVPDEAFPPRASHKKRRRRRAPVSVDEEDFACPAREQTVAEEPAEEKDSKEALREEKTETAVPEELPASQASTAVAGSEPDTPATSHPPSEDGSAHPRPQSSSMPAPTRPSGASHARNPTIPAVPLIPIKPIKAGSVTSTTQKSAKPAAEKVEPQKADGPASPTPKAEAGPEETPKPSPPAKAAPKSWADLVRSRAAPAPAQSPAANGVVATTGPPVAKSNSLSDALASFSVHADTKVSFLEPRGLVNSGNLCYMNSVRMSVASPLTTLTCLDSSNTIVLCALL
jgi:ubiquitin carboxyl-terminal hydrolase 10